MRCLALTPMDNALASAYQDLKYGTQLLRNVIQLENLT
jgi:hypothetical protein